MVNHIFIFEDIGSHSHHHITDQYDNVTLLSVLDIYDDEKDKQDLIDKREKGCITQNYYIRDGVLKIQALNEYDWCFTIDIDEFITLEEPYKAIPDVLSEFNDKVAVLLQWMNFGACGRIYKPNYNGKDYREFYTEPSPQAEIDIKHSINTKIVWNLNKITKWHLCGLHCTVGDWCNTNGKKKRNGLCYEKMYLKHYITKSWEEYIWKLYIRGMHCKNRHRSDKDFFDINPDLLPMYDELIEIKNKILKI